MSVYTAMSGLAIAPSLCISPKLLMPSSTTAASVSGPMRKSVSGTPNSLLKFFFRARAELTAQDAGDHLASRGLAGAAH